jgi:hypothetical protein
MFEKTSRYFFKKRVSKHLREELRERRFVNIHKARTVMLVFESDFMERNPEIRMIIRDLQDSGARVRAWGYVDKKEVSTANLPDFKILYRKSANKLRFPFPVFMRELEETEFDLLIDLTTKEILPLQYLVLHANAGCKAGVKKGEVNLYDFVVDLDNNRLDDDGNPIEPDVLFVYNQINFYLKNIQSSD